jgi:hypothetical protein
MFLSLTIVSVPANPPYSATPVFIVCQMVRVVVVVGLYVPAFTQI